MPTPKPVVRTLIVASWKTPMFDGVAGITAVTLTANRTAAAAPIPTRLVEPERGEQRVAGEQLQSPGAELGDGGDRAAARVAEDDEAACGP